MKKIILLILITFSNIAYCDTWDFNFSLNGIGYSKSFNDNKNDDSQNQTYNKDNL